MIEVRLVSGCLFFVFDFLHCFHCIAILLSFVHRCICPFADL